MSAFEVGTFHTETHFVAQIVNPLRAATHQTVVVFVKLVVIARKVAERHHAFALGEDIFDVNAEFCHAGDYAVELLADAVGHKFRLLVLYRRALGRCRHLFALGAVFAQLFVLLCAHRSAAFCVLGEQTVYHQVRIAADGRGEMRVVAEHQSVVSDVVYRIARFHHGAQCHDLHHIFLFLALYFAEQVVEGVRNLGFRAFGAHLVAEFRHEAAQFLELFGIRHVVNTIR